MTELSGVIRWGGLPVPYVAAWSSESGISIRYDALLGAPAVFRDGSRGTGKPIFGKMDESRVRAVVLGRKCQVCARSLGLEAFVLDWPCAYVREAPVMNEPPACEPCFRVSLELCPGIARQRKKPRAFAARIRRYDPVASQLQPVDTDAGGDPELNRALAAWNGKPPVGYLRCALTDYDVIDLRSFASQVVG